MGIVKLAEVIKEEAPDAVRPASLQDYRGRVVALDASVAVHQFRTAMPQIINRHRQNISSLQGLFFRTLHLLQNDLKPLFVIEGKPPQLKLPVLAKRATASGARRAPADSNGPARPPRRDSETLLTLLGVPYVQAPAEAEATCAALVKSGHAWCAVTEDMDALPFGAVRLLRHLGMKKSPLEEISLPIVLQKLGMTQEQFVDLCILLGCDYCPKVRGLGPKKALKLLQLHGSIEEVLRKTSRKSFEWLVKTHPMPDGWCLQEARRLFLQPEVTDPGQVVLEWKEPDEEGLVNFLTHQKHMKEPSSGSPEEMARRPPETQGGPGIHLQGQRETEEGNQDHEGFLPCPETSKEGAHLSTCQEEAKVVCNSPGDLKERFPWRDLGSFLLEVS